MITIKDTDRDFCKKFIFTIHDDCGEKILKIRKKFSKKSYSVKIPSKEFEGFLDFIIFMENKADYVNFYLDCL